MLHLSGTGESSFGSGKHPASRQTPSLAGPEGTCPAAIPTHPHCCRAGGRCLLQHCIRQDKVSGNLAAHCTGQDSHCLQKDPSSSQRAVEMTCPHLIPSQLKHGVLVEGEVVPPQALKTPPWHSHGSVHLSVLSLRLVHSVLLHFGIPETWGFIVSYFPRPEFLEESQQFHSKQQNKTTAWGFPEGWEAEEGPGGPVHVPAHPQVNPRCHRLALATAGPGRLSCWLPAHRKPRPLPAPTSWWGKMKRAGAACVGGWEMIKARDQALWRPEECRYPVWRAQQL